VAWPGPLQCEPNPCAAIQLHGERPDTAVAGSGRTRAISDLLGYRGGVFITWIILRADEKVRFARGQGAHHWTVGCISATSKPERQQHTAGRQFSSGAQGRV